MTGEVAWLALYQELCRNTAGTQLDQQLRSDERRPQETWQLVPFRHVSGRLRKATLRAGAHECEYTAWRQLKDKGVTLANAQAPDTRRAAMGTSSDATLRYSLQQALCRFLAVLGDVIQP